MMISAAELVTEKLGGPEDGEYATWLRDCFEGLRCRERGLIEALVDLGAPIATTNYDNLLEEVTGLRPVTWKHPGAIQRVLQKDEPRIIHLHGHWEEPESVVLGTRSYERVKEASAAQAIQQAVTVFNKLVFVGCGDGLEDPNFEALRAFLRTFRASESRHYRLCREDEAERLRQDHEGEPIRVLPYGEGYGDLLPFLRGLRPPGDAAAGATAAARPASMAEPKPMGTPFDVPPLRPDYLERPEDLDRIRELFGENRIVGITGRPGRAGSPRKASARRSSPHSSLRTSRYSRSSSTGCIGSSSARARSTRPGGVSPDDWGSRWPTTTPRRMIA